MVEDFVASFARLIAAHPEDVSVKAHEGDEVTEITLYANQADVGKLIGKEGKMIGARITSYNVCYTKLLR